MSDCCVPLIGYQYDTRETHAYEQIFGIVSFGIVSGDVKITGFVNVIYTENGKYSVSVMRMNEDKFTVVASSDDTKLELHVVPIHKENGSFKFWYIHPVGALQDWNSEVCSDKYRTVYGRHIPVKEMLEEYGSISYDELVNVKALYDLRILAWTPTLIEYIQIPGINW
jgi:hypothetical protein